MMMEISQLIRVLNCTWLIDISLVFILKLLKSWKWPTLIEEAMEFSILFPLISIHLFRWEMLGLFFFFLLGVTNVSFRISSSSVTYSKFASTLCYFWYNPGIVIPFWLVDTCCFRYWISPFRDWIWCFNCVHITCYSLFSCISSAWSHGLFISNIEVIFYCFSPQCYLFYYSKRQEVKSATSTSKHLGSQMNNNKKEEKTSICGQNEKKRY